MKTIDSQSINKDYLSYLPQQQKTTTPKLHLPKFPLFTPKKNKIQATRTPLLRPTNLKPTTVEAAKSRNEIKLLRSAHELVQPALVSLGRGDGGFDKFDRKSVMENYDNFVPNFDEGDKVRRFSSGYGRIDRNYRNNFWTRPPQVR